MAALFIRSSGTRLCPLVFKSSSKKNRLQLKPSSFSVKQVDPSHFKVPCQVSAFRCYFTSSVVKAESSTVTHKDPNTSSSVETSVWKNEITREHYIPITRQSIVRYLVEERDILTEDERKLFLDFVYALDTALVNKYHGVLEELKVLFDPSNPDKETLTSRQFTRKEKLDNEFSLLQQLENIMAKANFHELTSKKFEQFLRDHETLEKVMVRVDPSRYDVIRFWVLGHEVPKIQLSLLQKFLKRVLHIAPRKPVDYYKRVVVALRLKKDSKLTLKAFKEVPVQGLEKLLPDGSIHMRTIDKGVLVTSVAVSGFGILAKVAANFVGVDIDWSLILTILSGALGFRVWYTYTDKRNKYLVDVARLLFFKNIANNRGLLKLLVDRAQDESLKEALLAYVFLLNSQPHDLRNKIQSLFVTLSPGALQAKS